MEKERCELLIGGVKHLGWTSIAVSLSMARVSGTFSLTITEKYPGSPDKHIIKPGSRCEVRLAGKTVITGWVDKMSPSYGPDKHEIQVNGRDATCDLADCSHLGPPTQWKGQTLLQIAEALCRPFNIPVRLETGVDQGQAFKDVKTNEGDSVLSFLARLCKKRGVFPVSYGDGALCLTNSLAAKAGGSIRHPGNAENGSANVDDSNRFSRYIVKGQDSAKSPDGGWGGLMGGTPEERRLYQAMYVSPSATVDDSAITRFRPKVILAESKGGMDAMQKRAAHEAAVRAGQSRRLSHVVTGWLHPGGDLWRINTLCNVQDELLGVSGLWLLETVNFKLSESGGTTSTLNLVHPDAYKPAPQVGDVKGLFG